MHNFFLLFFLGRLAKILVGNKSMTMQFLIITYNIIQAWRARKDGRMERREGGKEASH